MYMYVWEWFVSFYYYGTTSILFQCTLYMCTCTCTHVHVHVHMHVFMCSFSNHMIQYTYCIHVHTCMYIHVCTCTSQTCTCTHMYKLQFYIIIHLWDHWLHSGRPRRTSEILVQGKEHEWADVNKKYLVQCRYCGGFLQGEVIDFKCTYTFVHVRTCMCANLLIVFISVIRVS